MILDIPASRYFHLHHRARSAIRISCSVLKSTYVALRSSRFGIGGIITDLVATDIFSYDLVDDSNVPRLRWDREDALWVTRSEAISG
jgi:hypothetical protein